MQILFSLMYHIMWKVARGDINNVMQGREELGIVVTPKHKYRRAWGGRPKFVNLHDVIFERPLTWSWPHPTEYFPWPRKLQQILQKVRPLILGPTSWNRPPCTNPCKTPWQRTWWPGCCPASGWWQWLLQQNKTYFRQVSRLLDRTFLF